MAYSFPNSPLWMICSACAVHCIHLWSRRSWRMPSLDHLTNTRSCSRVLRASATFCMLWRPNGMLISLSISMKNGNHCVVFARRLLLKHTFDTDYTKLHLRTRDYICVTYCTVMCIFWRCAFLWRNARWPQMTLACKITGVKKMAHLFDRITFLSKY